MAKKKGAKYKCDECGLVVVVDEPCGCEPTCELVCCETPMREVQEKRRSRSGKPAEGRLKKPERFLEA